MLGTVPFILMIFIRYKTLCHLRHTLVCIFKEFFVSGAETVERGQAIRKRLVVTSAATATKRKISAGSAFFGYVPGYCYEFLCLFGFEKLIE